MILVLHHLGRIQAQMKSRTGQFYCNFVHEIVKQTWLTLQIDLPKSDVVVAHRDDAAIYDDGSQGQETFKDDSR